MGNKLLQQLDGMIHIVLSFNLILHFLNMLGIWKHIDILCNLNAIIL